MDGGRDPLSGIAGRRSWWSISTSGCRA